MQRYGVLGKSLVHSYSPMIHAELGDYEYKNIEKSPEELEEFLTKGDFAGLNVAIPYKQAVIKYCNSLSMDARTAGSVNTIVRQSDGSLHGDSTDGYGFMYMLSKIRAGGQENRLPILCSPVLLSNEDKVLILGSGGSSHCVQVVLKDLGVKNRVVISRTGEDNYDNISKHYDATIIVNTTPVGMYPENGHSPLKYLSPFVNCKLVIDLIYNPPHTKLLFDAEKCGIPSVSGLPMLVAQAKRSAELFLRSPIRDSKIDEVITKIESKTRNILLIGMPGCGKSSIGAALAEKMGREFADTDSLIEKTAGKKVEDIFAQDGEEAFRKLENEALEALCKRSSLVIATGGGIVKNHDNRNILRQNGTIIYLDRALSELQTSGRPLSESEGVEKLAAERLPLYSEWSDFTIRVRGIEETAAAILQYWEGVYS